MAQYVPAGAAVLKELVFKENPWDPHLLCQGGAGLLGAHVPAHYPSSRMFNGFPIHDLSAMRGSGKSSLFISHQDRKHMSILKDAMRHELRRHYQHRSSSNLAQLGHDGFAAEDEKANIRLAAFSYSRQLPWISRKGETLGGVPLTKAVVSKKWHIRDPEAIHAGPHSADIRGRLRREHGAVFTNPYHRRSPYEVYEEKSPELAQYEKYIENGILHKRKK